MTNFETRGFHFQLLDDGSLEIRVKDSQIVRVVRPRGQRVLQAHMYQAHADLIRQRSFEESQADIYWGSQQSTYILHEFPVLPLCNRCFEEQYLEGETQFESDLFQQIPHQPRGQYEPPHTCSSCTQRVWQVIFI